MIKELFKFTTNDDIFYFTSSDTDELESGNLYISRTIDRSEIFSKASIEKGTLNIQFDIDDEIARQWLIPDNDLTVTLDLFFKEDGDVTLNWKGRLVDRLPENSKIIFKFEDLATSMRQNGIQEKFQRTCGYGLYDDRCRLNKDDWEVIGTVDALNKTTVTMSVAATYEDGYFTAGMLRTPNGAFRYISNHVGNVLTLLTPSINLETEYQNAVDTSTTLSISIYPGCDRSKEVCKNKFDNIENNGSTPFIPLIDLTESNELV